MFELDPRAAGEFWIAAPRTGATDATGAITGAIIAVSAGRSATFRDCFRASAAEAATGVPAFGATVSDGSVDPVGNIVWITESSICTGDAIASDTTGCVPTGPARFVLKGFVDPEDQLPNTGWIESATGAGDAGTARSMFEGFADSEDRPSNMVWISGSFISTGDAVASNATGCVPTGTARLVLEGFVDSEDRLPSIDSINEPATCTGGAGTARCVLEALVDPDDCPPNIDRIIESASCVGEAVVAGVST